MILTLSIMMVMFSILTLNFYYKILLSKSTAKISDFIYFVVTSALFAVASYFVLGIATTAIVLLMLYGIICLFYTICIISGGHVGSYLIPLYILSIIVVAIAVGVLWGGLILF